VPVILTDITEQRVATVTLNRPERRNALDGELLRALRDTMAALDAHDGVDVIVVTGTDPAFCAGVDLKELGGGRNLVASSTTAPAGPWAPTTKPVIGAVNGPAVTGGLEIALQCDFLVASERAAFADTHARVGIMPGWGLSVLLPQAVGIRKAKEMSLTGNFVDAREAHRIGLVNHVVPHAELLATANRLAQDIAGNDQRAVRQLRASYDDVTSTTPADGLRREAELAARWNADAAVTSTVEQRRQAIVERGRAQL
jgi:enoyl-CoA hydratase